MPGSILSNVILPCEMLQMYYFSELCRSGQLSVMRNHLENVDVSKPLTAEELKFIVDSYNFTFSC